MTGIPQAQPTDIQVNLLVDDAFAAEVDANGIERAVKETLRSEGALTRS